MTEPVSAEQSMEGQSRTSANLSARKDLHARFSTSKYDWHLWAYDHLTLSKGERVLELGCGPAWMWQRNMSRIPASLRLLLSDSSPGMVEDARQNLWDAKTEAGFAVIDAQALPLDAESFDLVIANHMLYHVADIRTALREIRRVLKVGGRLIASTIGKDHMKALRDLTLKFDPSFGSSNQLAERFGLETGLDQLMTAFEEVTAHRHEDTLVVTEAQPVVDYVVSTRRGVAVKEKPEEFLQFVRRRMEESGPVHIPKVAGLFRAVKTSTS